MSSSPLLLVATLAAVSLAPALARADLLPPDSKRVRVSVTFTLEGKGHLVAFPSDCSSPDGNPGRYDVVEPGQPREPYKRCGEQTALYILDEVAFPKTKGPEQPAWIGSSWKIDAIDKIPEAKRAAFFAPKQGLLATGYTMPAYGFVSESSPLKEVRERISFADGKVSKAEITYVYTDASEETVAYPPGSRPQPGRKEAQDWMKGLAASSASASPSAPPPPSASAPPPPSAAPSASASPSAPPAPARSCAGCAIPGRSPAGGLLLAMAALGALVQRRRR